MIDTLRTFDAGKGKTGLNCSLPALEEKGLGKISRLPVSLRIVLESVLRNCDGKKVTEKDVETLAAWNARAPAQEEIPFVVARIVLQDFTGVPLLVDLAAMRSAVANLKKDPKIIEPLVPVDLVVDHSVQVDFFGSAQALRLNLEMEFKRNRERYKFLKWGQQAFKTFGVVPPGIGIVHQVNLEYLAKGVLSVKTSQGTVYPDTLVGTDSHTTMINGLGVVGWGVGGIEAEAGMLGQPVYFLTPEVPGASTSPARSRKESPRRISSSASRKCFANRRSSENSSNSLAKARRRSQLPIEQPSGTWLRNTAPRWASLGWTKKLSPTCVALAAARNSARPSRNTIRSRVSGEFRARATSITLSSSSSILAPSCRAKAASGSH